MLGALRYAGRVANLSARANARHAARHAEGRGYGREDRDGGLNDKAPYLSFLFIHDFFFRLRVDK